MAFQTVVGFDCGGDRWGSFNSEIRYDEYWLFEHLSGERLASVIHLRKTASHKSLCKRALCSIRETQITVRVTTGGLKMQPLCRACLRAARVELGVKGAA